MSVRLRAKTRIRKKARGGCAGYAEVNSEIRWMQLHLLELDQALHGSNIQTTLRADASHFDHHVFNDLPISLDGCELTQVHEQVESSGSNRD